MCSVSEAVGKRVRQRRRLLDMTQAQMADKIGVRAQQVQKWECGQNGISLDRLFQICAALSLAPVDLLEGITGEHDRA